MQELYGRGVTTRSLENEQGLSKRAFILALLLSLLAGFWVRRSEIMVLATQITESVPAIPGLAALALLIALNYLFRNLRKARPFSTAELLTVFLFVTVSTTIMGIGVTQFLFSLMTLPFYLKTKDIVPNRAYLPKWLAPHNLQAIKHLYEGAPNGVVPWHLWIVPCLCWLGFFLALWWCLASLMGLLYHAWADDERLSFPLVALPLEMSQTDAQGPPFFRNPLMWSGFALAAVYNLINIAHALAPAFPAIGKQFDLSPLFNSPPWSEMKPLIFHIRPELIGLGFLVSTEISLTVWVSYFVLKLAAVFGVAHGASPGLLPYFQEEGIGAYMVLAVLLIWLARRRLKEAWKLAWREGESAVRSTVGLEGEGGGLEGESAVRSTVGLEGKGALLQKIARFSGDPGVGNARYRRLWLGFFGGFLISWGYMWMAGMGWWIALAYLALVVAVAMVYGRLRAEAGVPLIWLFPYQQQKAFFLYTFGSAPFARNSPSTLTIWALFVFLARGYFPEMTGYQIESLEIARRVKIRAAKLFQLLALAVVVGIILGWYNHLVPYYQHGVVQLRGEIWGQWLTEPEYSAATGYMKTPKLPDIPRIYATVIGALIAFLLWWYRIRFTGFWFHPIGYVMTCSYGSLIWGPFLVVWIIKSLVLRYGGMPLYRRLIPFFLGLALGHFAVAGILWGLTGAWVGSAVQGYPVFFG